MTYRPPVNRQLCYTPAVGILLVCVVLQTNRYGLPDDGYGTADDYGSFQLMLMLCVIPLIVYALVKNVQSANRLQRQRTRTQQALEEVNPVSEAFENDGTAQQHVPNSVAEAFETEDSHGEK